MPANSFQPISITGITRKCGARFLFLSALLRKNQKLPIQNCPFCLIGIFVLCEGRVSDFIKGAKDKKGLKKLDFWVNFKGKN